MNILIVYSTNTGNTYLAAQVIRDMLSKDHHVTLTPSSETKPDDLDQAELIIIGSSSWDWKGKEGHPLHSMMAFLESIKSKPLYKKSFVVFGCGDKDFRVFCGAVTHIEDYIKQAGGQLIFKPLKVDKLYHDILRKLEIVKDWANKLSAQLATKPN